MRIERVDTYEEFLSLEADWKAVYRADPEAQFFLSWKWLRSVFDKHRGEWFVLAVHDRDGAALGFLPLRRKTVWNESGEHLCNNLHFAGRLSWADYGGILCLTEHEEAVLDALARHLKQMNWSHLYLKEFRISDRRFALFMAPFEDSRLTIESRTSLINHGETDNLVCPYVELPATFEAYLAERLSSNTRQKMRRILRKFESSPEYRITESAAATRERDVEILEVLWSRLWRKKKGSGTERLASKYGSIVRRGLKDELARLLILWHGETAIGALASFVDWEKSRLLFFVTGRDENFDKLPLGLILHASNIRWAIQNRLRTYDLLRGNEAYKYSLGASDVRLKYPLIRTNSGVNLNGVLDPGCLIEALRLALDSAKQGNVQQARTACCQVLDRWPGQQEARLLLDMLDGVTPDECVVEPLCRRTAAEN